VDSFAAALGRPVADFTAVNEDLEQMLALLALIDDYVGVSNANMHLRAAVGRQARVLVPAPAEWRWMAAGASPWFAGFGVYRQALDASWKDALAALRGDLSREA
jgi:ADP-heptose:LPS heptosyltransferase